MDELGLLERLVRRSSPSGSEAGAVAEFVRIARELGYATRVDRAGNGIARRGAGRPRVLFLGHIDTVEGEIPVRRRGHVLRGRGVVDAKGPLLAALLAGRDHAGPGEYSVVAAVGEETDSRGARCVVAGRPADAVIAGEPSGWDGVTVGYKGMVQLDATFRDPRAHHSSPVPTAMDRAVDWVGELRSFVAARAGPSPFRSLTMKVVGLESGRVGGTEVARVSIDVRVPPGMSTDEIERSVPRGAKPFALRVRVRIEPVEVGRTNPVVDGLVAGIRRAGGRPTLWRKGGTSDMNLAVAAWGVPAAAYGPGDSRLDHTEGERMSEAELLRAVGVLRVALERLRALPLTPPRSAAGA